MQRANYLAKRSNKICKLLIKFFQSQSNPYDEKVIDWIGKIHLIDSTFDGYGVLSVKLADDLFVQTWNNAVSEALSDKKTLIKPNSKLFNSILEMKEGQRVKFSGYFVGSPKDCIEEQSMTQTGKLLKPEFTFQFSKISKIK